MTKPGKIAAALALVLALGLVAYSLPFLAPDPLAEDGTWSWSVRLTDRQGRLLKEFLPPQPARSYRRPLEAYSPYLPAAVLAAEDKRFYSHGGIDPLALLRAAWLNLRGGQVRSGGSTVTMQLARLRYGLTPGPRTLSRKLKELWWALVLERRHSKDEILAAYLNQVPCGHLSEGFEAAAEVYLGKSAADLSAAEAAFLAALPAAPGALNPYRDPGPVLARRNKILRLMARQGSLSQRQLRRALAEPLALKRLRPPFAAPHLVSHLRARLPQPPPPLVRSSLDLELQLRLEELVAQTVAQYRRQGLTEAAVVLMNRRREVLAWVGSADFFAADDGQNDGVTALRQPGSALKPFIYALALDRGLISAGSLIDDRAQDYRAGAGSFSPVNYSGHFYGAVSARLALASSLNLPAVKLTEALGLESVVETLRSLGLGSLKKSAGHYGLSLALGGGEVDLLSLTAAYAALADGGLWRPPRLILEPASGSGAEPEAAPRQVFSPGAAFVVSDILADAQARVTGFGSGSVLDTPYPAAVKTGTSQNFRDNWALGYLGDFVLGVWAGNFQGRPMDQVSGLSGAGTLWRRVADLLAQRQWPADFHRPPDLTEALICPFSSLAAGPDCPGRRREYFLPGRGPRSVCEHGRLSRQALGVTVPVLGLRRSFGLLRPLAGESYALDPGLAPASQLLEAQAQSVPEVDELLWKLNGCQLARQPVSGHRRVSLSLPLSPGPARLELLGLSGGRVAYRQTVDYLVEGEAVSGASEGGARR